MQHPDDHPGRRRSLPADRHGEIARAQAVLPVRAMWSTPGLYEVPFGVTLRHLLYDLAGGRAGRHSFKAVLFGGAAGAFATEKDLDVRLSFEDLRAAGLPLGSGVVTVFDETRDLRDVLLRLARFFADECCGKCYPCQIGTQRQHEILRRVAGGNRCPATVERLADVGWTMTDASLCGLGQTAASAVLSAIRLWPEMFDGKQVTRRHEGTEIVDNSNSDRHVHRGASLTCTDQLRILCRCALTIDGEAVTVPERRPILKAGRNPRRSRPSATTRSLHRQRALPHLRGGGGRRQAACPGLRVPGEPRDGGPDRERACERSRRTILEMLASDRRPARSAGDPGCSWTSTAPTASAFPEPSGARSRCWTTTRCTSAITPSASCAGAASRCAPKTPSTPIAINFDGRGF